MTTSGIYTVQYTRNELIEAALRKLGVLADGQTPSATNYTNGTIALNSATAELRALKVPLWARATYSFTPVATTQTYQIGTGKTLDTVFPLHILQAFRQDNSNTTRIPLEVVSNYNFNMYPINSGGMPIQLTYQPFVNYGEIKLWPVPDASATSSTITIVYQKPFQYFVNSTDTMDFPEEYYNAIIYKLAVLLAPEWGIPLQDRQLLRAEAKEHLDSVLETGEEDASLFWQPRNR